jgi:hypothetical protein
MNMLFLNPTRAKHFMHHLSKKPMLTRVIGVAQIAGGIYWALKQDEMD